MTDAEGPKNDGEEQVDSTAPASADAPAAEQAPTDGSAGDATEVASGSTDEPLYDAAAESAAADDTAAAGSADDVPPSDAAPFDAPAAEPELTRSGPEPQTTEFSAEGAAGVEDTSAPVSADRRGEDTAADTADEEPDYEALAAELDRLEADTAAAAPVAPGAREPEPTDETADPWFEPATSQTFSASAPPQQSTTLDEPDATPHAESTPPPAAAPGPVFVQAPEPPRKRGNRGAAGLIGLLAAVVFALLYAVVNYVWEAFLGWGTAAFGEGTTDPALFVTDVLLTPPFWFTVVAFWLSFWLLGVFVNRARWWSWVVLGIIVAVLTYVGFIVGHFLEAPFWNLTSDEGVTLLGNLVFSPIGLLALILAREVTIWFGSWVSRRGARVTRLNEEERAEYDKVMAEGPKAP